MAPTHKSGKWESQVDSFAVGPESNNSYRSMKTKGLNGRAPGEREIR